MTLLATVPHNPLEQLKRWLAEAEASGVKEPTAMALATATPDGHPSLRIVLCKTVEDGAVVFYTNYESRKGAELAANPRAAASFYWAELGRQVRLEGTVARTSRTESEAYYAVRPRGSQVGGWVSAQSRPIASYHALEVAYAAKEREFGAGPVPCPPLWGGYRLTVESCELWLGLESRLHDRVLYRRAGQGWEAQQLAP